MLNIIVYIISNDIPFPSYFSGSPRHARIMAASKKMHSVDNFLRVVTFKGNNLVKFDFDALRARTPVPIVAADIIMYFTVSIGV